MAYRIFEDWEALGTSLLTMGPGDSAFMTWRVRPPREGRRAMVRTRMPMPPSQWVKERQKRMPLGRPSTAGRMEEPVVVKPEMDSKKQSTKLAKSPQK